MINKVKEIRESKKLTQTQLATMAGVDMSIIESLENNKNMDIEIEDGLKIAKALEEDVRNIFII